MANPVVIEIPIDSWIQVASGIQIGNLWIIDSRAEYFHSYRDYGSLVPVTDIEAVRLPLPGLPIRSSIQIDVYILARKFNGLVRLDRV